MLVITRKIGEEFYIGENIRVTVVETTNASAKIGIEAPSNIRIIRSEHFDTEKFNIQAAAYKPAADLISMIKNQQNSNK